MSKMDTENKFLVGMCGNGELRILVPLPHMLSHKDALNLAAWLVALAEDEKGEFDKLLEAIKAT